MVGKNYINWNFVHSIEGSEHPVDIFYLVLEY